MVEPSPGRWRVVPIQESEPSKLERALHERVKELNCLYGLAQLAKESPDSLDQVLRSVVSLLPPSWQYPEITCARITFRGEMFKSKGFRVTKWRQIARIVLYNEPVGEVGVFYLEERPPLYEGPFLREERILLEAVAEHIAAMAKRIFAEQELHDTNRQLRVEREALQEANTALRAVLSRIEDEKRDIQRQIQANVEKILMPMVYALAMEVPKSQRRYVELLRDNLEGIASPFISQLSEAHRSLTPTEIGICNMIKTGLTSKEIAQIRGVSPATISRHRERVRRKLGITGSETNLASYLQGIM
ncbi:MAG: helix-turn-helix transcriptional regulator [Armatimonadota bacterium]|nr:MAG: helix-turn-helix transcriptional regulator [Armatimonadota bacterium]